MKISKRKLAKQMKKLLSNIEIVNFDSGIELLKKHGFTHDQDCMVKDDLLICFDSVYNGYFIDMINLKNDKMIVRSFYTKNAYLN